MSNTNLLIVGVGGQGTLLASKVVAEVAIDSGLDVKASEVHGMAQRGGSVVTHVKFGEEVQSALVGVGDADIIVAFEELEALRWLKFLRIDGLLIANTHKILPLAVAQGLAKYPHNLHDILKDTVDTQLVNATGIAQRCGNAKATNMVLLGVLASKLSMEKRPWIEAIGKMVPSSTLEVNLKAFEEGYHREDS